MIRYYLHKYRTLVFFGIIILLCVDLLETVPPLLLKRAVDIVVDKSPVEEIYRVAAIYLGISFFQALCRFGWRMLLIQASMRTGRDLRSRFASHLYSMSPSFFDRHRIGELMSLATSDVEATRMMIGAGTLVAFDALFYFLTIPVAMMYLSPQLTALAFIALPIVPWIVWRNERQIHKRYEAVQNAYSELSSFIQECIAGTRTIKAFAQEGHFLERLTEKSKEFIRLNLHLARVQSAFGPTLDFAMSLGLTALLWWGGRGVVESTVTLGTFVAFQRYIQKLSWPMAAIGIAVGHYQKAATSSMRIQEILDEKTDTPERSERLMSRSGSGLIEVTNLNFRYPGQTDWALKDLSLTIRPGERVALVGRIGSGKSTLMSLFPRLYPVPDHCIRIDGVDINDWKLSELRSYIGFVSQDVFLFSDSVFENLVLGLAESKLEIERYSKMAKIHEEIVKTPQAYDTQLGERGINLSGGQKQRLTLARALIRKPQFLILDDVLSAVDVETESQILKSMRGERDQKVNATANPRAELISAHRLSTILEADRIIVLDRGQKIQEGTHSELITEKSGLYAQLYHERQWEGGVT